jgi:CRISPR/Cas system-associated endonuclease Cas3-HD
MIKKRKKSRKNVFHMGKKPAKCSLFILSALVIHTAPSVLYMDIRKPAELAQRLNRNPVCPLLDLPTVPSFRENEVFEGRGIFKAEEKVSQGNGRKNYIILYNITKMTAYSDKMDTYSGRKKFGARNKYGASPFRR